MTRDEKMPTMDSIRDRLFDEIDGLRRGERTPAQVNAVCKAAGHEMKRARATLRIAKTVVSRAGRLDGEQND